MTAAATEPDPTDNGPDPDELVVCPKCDAGNTSDASFCDQCGFDLTSTGFRPADYQADADETLKCPACDKANDPDAKFCDQCGADLTSDNPTSQKPADAPDTDTAKRGPVRHGIKDATVRIKAGPDDNLPEGTFTAYASVFGNADSYGDVVVKGAFTKTLNQWSESGNPIPLLFGHNMSDPDYNIGAVTKAVEDDHGLLVTAELDLDNPKAQQVYRLLKGRRINQMSFAYDVMDSKEAKADDGSAVNELHDLRLYEVSVVTVGANQQTEVLAVKRALDRVAAKAGRTLSAANEKALQQAADLITGVLKSVDNGTPPAGGDTGTDQGKASGTTEAKTSASAEDPARGKASVPAEEPKSNPSADHYLVAISIENRRVAVRP